VVGITLIWAEQAPKIESHSLATDIADHYILSLLYFSTSPEKVLLNHT
jgi:hypothetical protein